MGVNIKFLGAAETVTGSKYLVSGGGKKILVDAGMFQGNRRWREENWIEPHFDPAEIDLVLLTHAHVDHVGMLPRFHRQGLKAPIFCTPATAEIGRLILLDAARLQEEEAQYRGDRGLSRHAVPQPLYTEADARAVLDNFRIVPFDTELEIADGVSAQWRRMGHILGAASIALKIGGKSISFSGDIGRYGVPILVDPQPMPLGDLLLIESTYGDRAHAATPPGEALATVINETYKRGGVLLIPSFAVGRTQSLLYYIRELKEQKRIPDLPVIIDSPMARDCTSIYLSSADCYDETTKQLLKRGIQPFLPNKVHFVRDRAESIKLNSISDPMILISASGMLSGGRVLHHLKHRIGDPRNTLLFVGYQPEGGRGAWIKSGATSVRIMAEDVPVRAKISEISGLSAHADQSELLRWCAECSGKPGRVAVVHGEAQVATRFAADLVKQHGWQAQAAGYLEEWDV